MKLVTVKTFSKVHEAQLLKETLANNGIESYLFDENMNNVYPGYNIMEGGVKLKVDAFHFERVKLLVDAIQPEPLKDLNGDDVVCPNCHSKYIKSDYFLKEKNELIKLFKSFLSDLFPNKYEKDYICKSCNHIFQLKHSKDI